MQLIKPRQISGEIMTLIEEAEEKVIIVSPYFRVHAWQKMLNILKGLRNSRKEVEIYVRESEADAILEVFGIGFKPILIPNLHTKLYLNEKMGIVSSMNLLYSSDSNSLDIAVKTENEKEYNDLWEYYLKYIKRSPATSATPSAATTSDLKKDIISRLSQSLGYRPSISEEPGTLIIQANNRYEVFVKNDGSNELRISGVLTQKELECAIKKPGAIFSKSQRIEYVEGGEGEYNKVWAVTPNLNSNSIEDLHPNDISLVISNIADFIASVQSFKDNAWRNKSFS